MESSPDDMFGLGDDPGDEIFHSDEEEDDNDEGPSGRERACTLYLGFGAISQ